MVRLTRRLVFLQFLLIMVLSVGCSSDATFENLALTFSDYTPPPSDFERSLAVEPNLENAILYSSHIVIGEILSPVMQIRRTEYLYEVRVEGTIASIAGETLDGEIILVAADEQVLTTGDKHILFLNIVPHTANPFDFFNLQDWFLLRIDADNNLQRLKNASTRNYMAAFEDDKYNSLEPLVQYIQDYEYKERAQRSEIFSFLDGYVEQVDSLEELFELADVVMEVYITDISESGISLNVWAEYEVKHVFKDGELLWDTLVLPSTVQAGDTILCFLKSTSSPATRIGSLFYLGDPDYDSVRGWLEEASQP